MLPVLKQNIDKISELCREHHVKRMYAFGSAVRNDFSNNSDIDLLYEMDYSGFDFNKPDIYPYDPFIVFFDLKTEPEKLLGRKVDLISNQEFRNKYMRESVNRDKTLIYGRA
jgi:uncharacterized protein